MNREISFDIKHIKTYATKENARKAIMKAGFDHIRHLILQTEEGRFHPLFLGFEAIDSGVHFHFCVA